MIQVSNKFSDLFAAVVYDRSLDGGMDEQGDVEGPEGWNGRTEGFWDEEAVKALRDWCERNGEDYDPEDPDIEEAYTALTQSKVIILREDNFGFVSCAGYDSAEKGNREWDRIGEAIEEAESEDDEPLDDDEGEDDELTADDISEARQRAQYVLREDTLMHLTNLEISARLHTAFNAAGGRGAELADLIDLFDRICDQELQDGEE